MCLAYAKTCADILFLKIKVYRSRPWIMILFFIFNTKLSAKDTGIRGKVVNADGQPLIGATVYIKELHRSAISGKDGSFVFDQIPPGYHTLEVSFVGYARSSTKVTITALEAAPVEITLKTSASFLDESVVTSYTRTSRRLNTGNIGVVTAEEIAKQPVTDPIAALEGRVPGLYITQSSGNPGASFSVRVRGQNAISAGSNPLYVVDGVPLPGLTVLNQLSSAVGLGNQAGQEATGLSPFVSINPADIESIEVLKDADATSIYGSRGANGVILITTKTGKPGKLRLTVNADAGGGRPARRMRFLNTRQYVALRKEAFSNDRAAMTDNNAYDLLLFDTTTQYTDYQALLLGGTAGFTDLSTSISGGNDLTNFLIAGSYHREGSVSPGNFGFTRAAGHLSMNHSAQERAFSIQLNVSYSYTTNKTTAADLSSALTYIPNLPPLYDSLGNLAWQTKGRNWVNPLGMLARTSSTTNDYFLSDMMIRYRLFRGFSFKANLGFNRQTIDETQLVPIRSQNPVLKPKGTALFANTEMQGWIIEPQLEYLRILAGGRLEWLLGASVQQNSAANSNTQGLDYTSDQMLGSLAAAGTIKATNGSNAYHYAGLFSRLSYNWHDRYLVGLSLRRDGSSRFGPGKQWGTFGSVSAAWIFSNMHVIQSALPFLSFGKLRGSYGSSGNDQVSDYQFFATWTAASYPYQGTAGVVPMNLYNPDYSWEVNRKLEAAVELGLWQDRLYCTFAWFRNRSGNQLVNYTLSGQTGFQSVSGNFPALVQNTGLETEWRATLIQSRAFTWQASLTFTLPHNKLLRFDGLDASPYYSRLVIGQPLSVYGGIHALGVDPATGLYQFQGKHGLPVSAPLDSMEMPQNLGNLDPAFYGGLGTGIRYKAFNLDIFFTFRKTKALNYLGATPFTSLPGFIANQPTLALDRWQHEGEETSIQQATQSPVSPAGKAAAFLLNNSDARYSDATFVRLKNLSLSYTIGADLLKKLHLATARVYVHAQNLLTITRYQGADPESASFYSLPPLRVFTAGLQLNL